MTDLELAKICQQGHVSVIGCNTKSYLVLVFSIEDTSLSLFSFTTALFESLLLMIICDVFSASIPTYLLFSQVGKPILDSPQTYASSKVTSLKPVLPASILKLAMYLSAVIPAIFLSACNWVHAILSLSGSQKVLSMAVRSSGRVLNTDLSASTAFRRGAAIWTPPHLHVYLTNAPAVQAAIAHHKVEFSSKSWCAYCRCAARACPRA